MIGSILSTNQSYRCALSTNQNIGVVIKTEIVHKVGTHAHAHAQTHTHRHTRTDTHARAQTHTQRERDAHTQ